MVHPNVRGRVDSGRLAEEQAALRRVATLVARGASPNEVFETVAAEVARLLRADFSLVARYEADATLAHLASHPLELLSQLGPQTILDGEDLASIIQRSGQPSAIDYDKAPGPVAALARELGVRCAVGAPILVDDQTWGVTAAGWAQPGKASSQAAEHTAEFTKLIAAAIANAESREALGLLVDEQAALRRVATLVAQGVPSPELFSAVTKEVAGVFSGVEPPVLASVIRFDPGPECVLVGASRPYEREPVGSRWAPKDLYVSTRVLRTGRSARVDEADLEALGGPDADVLRLRGFLYQVGSPVMVEGRLWGAMTLNASKALPDVDERLMSFTELVATAIANAESRESLARIAGEQAALRRVATLVASGVEPGPLLDAIAGEVEALFGAEISAVVRFEGDGTVTVMGAHGGPHDRGARVHLDPDYVVAAVYRTGQAARFDLREWESDRPAVVQDWELRSALATPILVEGEVWGAITIASRDSALVAVTERRLTDFSALFATAIANAESRAELAASRARIVATADATRRRIERDLHDGAQQQLVSLALEVRAAQAALPSELADQRAELSRVVEGLTAVLDELREIASGIHPAILSEGGLAPALKTLARRSPIPVVLDVRVQDRLSESIEVAAYYVVAEMLTNAAKYAQASAVHVDVAGTDGVLHVSVRDDGIGGADPARGSGLVGLRDRVEALGGMLAVDSPKGRGTAIEVALPLTE